MALLTVRSDEPKVRLNAALSSRRSSLRRCFTSRSRAALSSALPWSARFAHEHAEFAAALEASGLDPVRGLELRATLQQCVARAAAAHGAAFGAAMQALDPDLMAQVQAAFGS